jgi:alkylation response protein AidB-like acyl-CoA dehydrogenase
VQSLSDPRVALDHRLRLDGESDGLTLDPASWDVEAWEAAGSVPSALRGAIERALVSADAATMDAWLERAARGRSLGAVLAIATSCTLHELAAASGRHIRRATLAAPWHEVPPLRFEHEGRDMFVSGRLQCVPLAADLTRVLVRTAPDELVEIDLGAQGVSVSRTGELGLTAARLVDISLSSVRVVAAARWKLTPLKLATITMQHRLRVARALLVWLRELLTTTFQFVGKRAFRDSVLATQQVVRHRIADLSTAQRTLAAQLRSARVADADQSLRVTWLCESLCALVPEFVKACQQLHGGRGFLNEHWVSRAYRDSRGLSRLLGTRSALRNEQRAELSCRSMPLPLGSALFGSSEHASFRARARALIAENIAPESLREEDGRADFATAQRRFAAEGLSTAMVPAAEGGPGLDFSYSVALIEELMAHASASAAVSLLVAAGTVFPLVATHATRELREELLPRILAGSAVIAFGVTEPNGGSDLVSSVRTQARLDGDEYVVDGSKMFITNAPVADYVLLLVRTSAEGAPFQASLLFVPMNLPGVKVSRPYDKLGLRDSPTGSIELHGVRVPKQNLLGRAGLGLTYLAEATVHERVLISAGALELARDSVTRVLTALSDGVHDDAARGSLLEQLALIEGQRACTYDVIAATLTGALDRNDAAMLKYSACEAAQRAIEGAANVVGERPCSRELEAHVTRALRDSRIFSVFAGSSEMMRDVHSASLLPRIRLGIWSHDV